MSNNEDSADISPSPMEEDRYDNEEDRSGEWEKGVKIQIGTGSQVKNPKSFMTVSEKCLINFVEISGDYLISAGRGHYINIWDLKEGYHIRRLKGHRSPVTGLYLRNYKSSPVGEIIVSCSEDGTILQWSLMKGDILRSIETEEVITCMGVMNDIIAVTGNHGGYIELRHLGTGQAYSSILAHEDPVDAIKIQEFYVCSATFDAPSCLKVWHFQFEQLKCIYTMDGCPDIEFCSLDISCNNILLGDSNKPILHAFEIKDLRIRDKPEVSLNTASGYVQHVRVVDGWVFACSANKKDVFLDVYKNESYEYLGKYYCEVNHVFCITAIVQHSEMTIVLGGTSLTVLTIDAAQEKLKSRNCQATIFTLQDYMFKNGSTIKEKDEHEKVHVIAENIEKQPELQTYKNESMQKSEESLLYSSLANLIKASDKNECGDMGFDKNYSHHPLFLSEKLKDIIPQTVSESKLKNYLEFQTEEQRVILRELDKSLGLDENDGSDGSNSEKKSVETVIEDLSTIKDENTLEVEINNHTSSAINKEDYSAKGDVSEETEDINEDMLEIELNETAKEDSEKIFLNKKGKDDRPKKERKKIKGKCCAIM